MPSDSLQPIPPDRLPRHVAIIMDGNGRWAKKRGLPRLEGHRRGVETVRSTVEAARELGVRFITLYAFSAENWKRPKEEVGGLMSLLEIFLKRELKAMQRDRVRLMAIGRIQDLPPNVYKILRETIEATAHFSDYTLVLALNYGSRTELVDAVQGYTQAALAGREDPAALSWDRLGKYLYTADIPDPDLVIRTSGETRVSNFLLLQSAYAEFVFTDVLWPDFSRDDLEAALRNYAGRERRFGLISEQVRTPTIS